MNDADSLLKDKEELVTEERDFPIKFESGSPSAIFDRLIVQADIKSTKVTPSLEKRFAENDTKSIIPDIRRSFDNQIERLVDDLKKSPNNANILINLANIYLRTRNFESATECFNQALSIDKENPSALTGLAKISILQDKPNEALTIYLKYVNSYPNDANIYIDLAYVYLRIEMIEQAKKAIERSIDLRPNNPNAYLTLGMLYIILKNLDKAISSFRKAASIDVKFSPAYNGMGVCYALKGMYSKAIKYLKIAHDMSPNDIHSTKNLAQAYINRGNFESASLLLSEYIKNYPFDFDAINALSFSYFKLGEINKSLQAMQTIVNNPEFGSTPPLKQSSIFNNIGVLSVYMRAFPEAENMFRKALATSEKPSPIIYFNLSKMLLNLGRYDEIERLIEKYLKVAPDDQTPLIILSITYMNNGLYEESKKILIEILQRFPESKEATILLASLYSEVFDEHEKAISMLEKLINNGESDQTILNDLAYSLIKNGQMEDAKKILDSIDWDKAVYALYATKGLLQINRGDLKDGIALYNLAVGKAPRTETKNVVRQKRNIEVARFYFAHGKKAEATKAINVALSIKTLVKIYTDQAIRLCEQIEIMPEQGRLISQ